MKKIALVLLVSILTGCGTASTTFSNTFIKPPQAITEMRVLYVENIPTFSANEGEPRSISDIGYKEIPELLRKRVPMVFSINDLNAEYATIQRQNSSISDQIQSVKWSAISRSYPALLIIDVSHISTVSGSHTPITHTVVINANLLGTQNNSKIWVGKFESPFAQFPFKYNGFDSKSTDNLLKVILEQMNRDGVVKLANGKAILPSKE